MNNILQLKITLHGSKPPIWRRVLVNKNITFERLHHIIQSAMGWSRMHPYEFDINIYTIAKPDEWFDPEDSADLLDATTTILESIITKENQKFTYLYDLDNDWQHDILVEEILPLDPKITYPVCIDGKLNHPPEDCGGIEAFYETLKAGNNKSHPDFKELMSWIEAGYNPQHFDIDEINEVLANLDDYIIDMDELFNI